VESLRPDTLAELERTGGIIGWGGDDRGLELELESTNLRGRDVVRGVGRVITGVFMVAGDAGRSP
jgi:hypothetical protein